MTKLSKALENLGDFTAEEKNLIASAGTRLTVPATWAPIVEGTVPDKVYLVLDGEVSIRKQREEVARLSAGELIGETGPARRRLRNATVVAETPLQVMHFTAANWHGLVERVPALSNAVQERALARS